MSQGLPGVPAAQEETAVPDVCEDGQGGQERDDAGTVQVGCTSHVTRHTSHVTRHTSQVARHTSHVTRHTSHVTRHRQVLHAVDALAYLDILSPSWKRFVTQNDGQAKVDIERLVTVQHNT